MVTASPFFTGCISSALCSSLESQDRLVLVPLRIGHLDAAEGGFLGEAEVSGDENHQQGGDRSVHSVGSISKYEKVSGAKKRRFRRASYDEPVSSGARGPIPPRRLKRRYSQTK
jgi:hypothetical protein